MELTMRHVIAIISLTPVLSLTVAGCQTSQISHTPSVQAQSDQLIGVIVTQSQNLPSRTAAVKTVDDQCYTFPGFDAMYILITTFTDDKGQGTIACGKGIDTSSGVGYDESNPSIDGTIYVTSEGLNTQFMLNPIFRTPDGGIYAMPGTTATDAVVNGTSMPQRTTVSIINESATIAITVQEVYPPVAISIIQMSAENQVLMQHQYSPGNVPVSLKPSAKAAYLIVQTGTSTETLRDFYTPDDHSLVTYSCEASGVCDQKSTDIGWP